MTSLVFNPSLTRPNMVEFESTDVWVTPLDEDTLEFRGDEQGWAEPILSGRVGDGRSVFPEI